jgi:hypothetical protein
LGWLGIARHEFAFCSWRKRVLEGTRLFFGKEYRDYVEKVIMTKKPHPEARPFGAFKIG